MFRGEDWLASEMTRFPSASARFSSSLPYAQMTTPLRRAGVLHRPVGIAGRVGIAPRQLQSVLEVDLLHEVLAVLQPIAPDMVKSALLQERESVRPGDGRHPYARKAVRDTRIELDGRVDVLVEDERTARRPGAKVKMKVKGS